MSEKKDSHTYNEKPKKIEISAWILKEKDKDDLEWRIVETLKKLNWKLTKKEILELFHRVEVSKWLDGLKKELEKEKMLWWKEITDELLNSILDLIKEAKEVAQKWIEELKFELSKLNESKFYQIDKKAYLSSKFPWVKKLEDSELGKNVVIDIAWIIVWLGDSAEAIFKLFLDLIKDLIMLPRDLAKKFSKQ
ncbi:MAG: hypothetical protein ACD_3C00007G0002 [uncultured bacterium (gcode 4)]|uniref:Uncharacterized protein n=1 Tax=uncultured bacterium (gcode 4) TaxID=1234023 RepID=K2G3B1_9BACT|nr:MAG: hypothetical protein ACD_3C00007G0002 [uncultured bacterium (gcode 4)]